MSKITLLLLIFIINSSASFNNLDEKEEKIIEAFSRNIERSIISSILYNCSDIKNNLGLSHNKIVPDTTHLKLDIWKGLKKRSFRIRRAASYLLKSELYNNSLPIVIFIHGFLSNSESLASSVMVRELIIHGGYNVLTLNSETLIKKHYLLSTNNVYYIGIELGRVLAQLTKFGIKPEDIHIIGHSLGAHIAGFSGKMYEKLTGFKLGKISGLDPAGPCFFLESPNNRLSQGDAVFIDVIHSNVGVYGYDHKIGDADFFPNNGGNQPGCYDSYCSHSRSWELYAESINHPRAFPALLCNKWLTFNSGGCAGNSVVYMGFPVGTDVRGSFYLRTGSASPYGKGDLGIEAMSTLDMLVYNLTRVVLN